MPTFYTKTISAILEPVAQQVSLLVVLHEEVESGVIIPDLKTPISVVKMAVLNLTDIGSQTYQSSKDEILKRDMPPALKRVEEASEDLEAAANILATDKTSLLARKKLIDGSRGILQGTSTVLVVYDMSEVRKIINICNNVKLIMNYIETISSMDQLANFIKTLTPQLTSMTKQTSSRAEELTVKAHADILIKSIDQIKNYTPLLLSSLKMLIINNENPNNTDLNSVYECKNNRNYTVFKLLEHIQEIIRVLLLTGETESPWWENEQFNMIRQSKTRIDSLSGLVEQWISNIPFINAGLYGAAVDALLENLQTFLTNCSDPIIYNKTHALLSDLSMIHAKITELQRKGEGSSPVVLNLKQQFQHKYDEAKDLCNSCFTRICGEPNVKIARTMEGRVAQAELWLANPEGPERKLGVLASKSLVEDGNHLKDILQSSSRNRKLINSLDESCKCVNSKVDALNNLAAQNKCKSTEGFQLTHELLDDFGQLKRNISSGVIDQVAENFVDLKGPIRRLLEAANAPPSVLNRLENFDNATTDFFQQGEAIRSTVNLLLPLVSDNFQVTNLKQLTDEVAYLTAQVISSGRIVLYNGGENCPQPIKEHLNVLKNDWESKIDILTQEIDKLTDTVAFVSAQESAIDVESENMEISIKNCSAPGIVEGTSKIARRANRIAQKVDVELSQNEDPLYVENVGKSVTQLRHTITPMAMSAKALMTNFKDQNTVDEWRKQNNLLREAVQVVKISVTPPTFTAISESMKSVNLSSAAYHLPPSHDTLSAFDSASDSGTAVYSSLRGSDISSLLSDKTTADNASTYYPNKSTLTSDVDFSTLNSHLMTTEPKSDEGDDRFDFPAAQPNQPILAAAHVLHSEARQWSSKDNEIVAAAKRMANLMAKLSQLVRGENGSKKELIDVAKAIAEASEEVTKCARKLGDACTDIRIKNNLLQICDRIPTIGTQLRILSTVKATMLGTQDDNDDQSEVVTTFTQDESELNCGSDEDQEATEMLVGNAKNLMQSVIETVHAAEAASIKSRIDSGYKIRWCKRTPWYQSKRA